MTIEMRIFTDWSKAVLYMQKQDIEKDDIIKFERESDTGGVMLIYDS